MMDRQDYLSVVRETWRQWDEALEGLDDEAMLEHGVVETWSIKDLIGHIAAWEQAALRFVEQWQRGEALTGLGGTSMDDFNAGEAARRREWTLAQVRDEASATRRRLQEGIASLSDADWAAVAAVDERQAPLGEWVGGAMGGSNGPGTHAAEHVDHVWAWRRGRESGSGKGIATA